MAVRSRRPSRRPVRPSILLITAFDMLFHRRRGRRIRPVRAFDVLLGVALVALSLLQIEDVKGQLPA